MKCTKSSEYVGNNRDGVLTYKKYIEINMDS